MQINIHSLRLITMKGVCLFYQKQVFSFGRNISKVKLGMLRVSNISGFYVIGITFLILSANSENNKGITTTVKGSSLL